MSRAFSVRFTLAICLALSACKRAETADASSLNPTFSREIAPVVFENCTPCHRPGGMGPFHFLTYQDVRKHAQQIAEVTQSHFMPPWPPARNGASFLGERKLSESQISLIQKWIAMDAPEGDPAKCPSAPQFNDTWQLGKPDLIVTMPEAFSIPADGNDIYRNFVLRVPNMAPQFVRAVEILPDNPKVIHHAFILLDRSGEARRMDDRDPGPGFGGMSPGPNSSVPPGYFAAWHPGSVPRPAASGIAWTLEPGTDIVLQAHLRPSGKPEKLRASVGLYFTEKRPTKFPFCLLLRSTQIDIPAGENQYTIESAYQLPVDVFVLSSLPHAHYLARDVRGWADLPDGTSREILHIPNWDFNWQNDYEFREPLFLPKGSWLRMRFSFDNSAENIRNPNTPPKRVRYGLESSDEMGELWMQLLSAHQEDANELRRNYFSTYGLRDTLELNQTLLARNPRDTQSHLSLATTLGSIGRFEEALWHLRETLQIHPNTAGVHRVMAQIYARQQKVTEACAEYENAVRNDPNDYVSHSDLGWLFLVLGRGTEAVVHLETALKINPNDEKTRQNLQRARTMHPGAGR